MIPQYNPPAQDLIICYHFPMQMKPTFDGILGLQYNLYSLASKKEWEMYKQMAVQLRDHFLRSVQTELSIAEVGIGTGKGTRFVLAADPRISVKGIDNSEVMLAQAEANLSAFIQDRRLELIRADGIDYFRQQPCSIDGFVSTMTLHNEPAKYRREILEQVYLSLKPGGIFLNGDKYQSNSPLKNYANFLVQNWNFIKAYLPRGETKLMLAWIRHMFTDIVPLRRMPEAESIDVMRGIGYRNVQAVYHDHLMAIVKAEK